MSDRDGLTPERIDEALDAMRRHGLGIMSGGSRWHTSWGWSEADASFFGEHCDEGARERHLIDEASMRETLRRRPAETLRLLYGAARRPGIEAMLRDDPAGMLAALEVARTYLQPSDDDELLAALLRDEVGEAQREVLRDRLRGHAVWHLFMNATGWTRTPENGRRGLAFLERVVTLVGPPEPFAAITQRLSFLGLMGDDAERIAVVERGLARDDLTAEQRAELHDRIARLHVQREDSASALGAVRAAVHEIARFEAGSWQRKRMLEGALELLLGLDAPEDAQAVLDAMEALAAQPDTAEHEQQSLLVRVIDARTRLGDETGAQSARIALERWRTRS